MSTDARRWKEKYLRKLDELDALENQFRNQTNLLQRTIVRVSLAADGLDEKLDRQLGELRALMRQNEIPASELKRQLEALEATLHTLDNARSQAQDALLNALTDMVEQLNSLDLPRDIRKALRRFAKNLDSRIASLREHPALLRELAGLQGQTLKHLTAQNAGQDGNRPGLLGRLFGRGDTSVAEDTDEPSTSDSITEGPDPAGRPASVPAEETESFDLPEAEIPPEPSFSAIEEHVSATLTHMVNQLDLPELAAHEAERIRQRIAQGLNWYELIPVLDDISNLVLAAVGKGQRDFEQFLKNLDERLSLLNDFLLQSESRRSDMHNAQTRLEENVRSQVSSISDSVRHAQDLESLKQAINRHVDQIIEAMDTFRQEDEAREQEAQAELTQLRERLAQMEAESREIQARLREEQHKARTDPLTGLPNREAFQERIEQEYARFSRYGNPTTLVIADIDYFKRINDQYGHLAGDKVIRLIGREVARRIRTTDFIARYGGEEFVIIMPETDAPTAVQVMDATRDMISRMPFHFRKERVQITMSFGVCAFAPGMRITDCLEAADQALYAAKTNGRNRVECAGSHNPAN
ncbi:MAG: diguanylate cyclase [Gammaproteobacteria bacterium]|nr:MAG: diguanylate cyclase [Gammaproteobacteria bacterium]